MLLTPLPTHRAIVSATFYWTYSKVMFESLSDRLSQSLKQITGKARLTEDNISDALRDVRMALLEADVALPVVKDFIDQVKVKAIGLTVATALNPGEAFIKLVHAELVQVMGEANTALNLATTPPAVILMAGLQGAGKTTTVAKLARFLQEREKKKVAVVSADVYRPAAIAQLETLAGEVGAQFIASSNEEKPLDIVNRALVEAKAQLADVLLVDTAGRLAVDDVMMDEKMSGGGRKKGAGQVKPDFPDVDNDGNKKEPLKKAAKEAKEPKTSGASRMGFTQSFGAARQNSYAKGAAKVASIMSFGASKKKGAADPNPEDPSHTHSMNQQDINSMRSTMGDFEGTQGGGGYANRSNYENFSKTSKTLPKGVIQDYSNSGGSANPYIAKDELQSVLNKTKGGMLGAGTDSDSPFTENPENPSSRAYYSPSSGVSGVDPQTNRETLYGGQQSNSNNVQAFSSAFQGNMRETIKLRKEGVKAKGLKSKGVVANTELKAPILGASKKPHGKKKKH